MNWLLDTNVLSEWWKPMPDSRVIAFLEAGNWCVPAPVIAEIQEGAENSPNDVRRIQINNLLDVFLNDYEWLIIPWDTETARLWGKLKHSNEVKRQPQALWDSLLDAMAVKNDLTIATRNTGDFRHARTFNPWRQK